MMMKVMKKDSDTGYHSCVDTYDSEEIEVTRHQVSRERTAGK